MAKGKSTGMPAAGGMTGKAHQAHHVSMGVSGKATGSNTSSKSVGTSRNTSGKAVAKGKGK